MHSLKDQIITIRTAIRYHRAQVFDSLCRETFLKNCARFCDHCQHKPEDLLDWGGK